MAVTIRNISLILFVIVIKCQTSTTRADDDDDDYPTNDDSSEEYVEPVTRQSVSSALFSTVATMRAMSRPPRSIGNGRDFINMTLCASNGEFYSNLQVLIAAKEILVPDLFCETGCGKSQPNPCPKRDPVCTGSDGNYLVYENECELNRTICERWGRETIVTVDPKHCQLESCGTPPPNPCPRRVPVCAGYEGNYTVYEDECQLNRTKCNRRGNGLEPIIINKIGACQIQVNASQLTCYEILRGKCPLGTTGKQVCNIDNITNERKTFKNICRALHKRCKKQDDTCYHIEDPCSSYNPVIHGTNPLIQDCSRFIRHSFPLVDAGRPCYDMSSSKKPTCKCRKAPFPAPDIPDFPSAMQPAHSTWI